jgi:hypothetical protein
MTFETIVFGSYEVGIGYTDGASISTGGLRVFVVPTRNVLIPMDVGITYVDQFGNTKTTLVTTSIPSATNGGTTGSHFQIVLNAGDSGIRDIIDITVIGGEIGDKFNLESWNEGIGRPAYTITRSEPNPQWIPSEPIKETTDITKTFSSFGDFYNTIQIGVVQSDYPDSQFSLPIETIEPDYEFEVNDFGLMRPITLTTKDNNLKRLRIELIPNQSYQYLDANEQSTILKWKWDISTSQYIDIGFYKLTFDYDVQFNSNFIFELLDDNGTVVWSRTTTGVATNQSVSFKSFSWEFRLRCKANYTTPSTTTYHAQITNIRIERYKEYGTLQLNYGINMPTISRYNMIGIDSAIPVPVGTMTLAQLTFSDDGSTWSDWIGPDGTSSTYFEGLGSDILNPLPLGLTGYYYAWAIYLLSDGRDTPVLYDITLYMSVKLLQKPFIFTNIMPYPYFLLNPKMIPHISFNRLCPRTTPGYPSPPPECTGGDYLPEPLSGNVHIQKTYPYIILCPRIIPGYPIPPPECIGGDYVPEPLSGKQLYAKRFAILKTWLESVVGQVISGYVQNISGEVIRNAFSLILMSTTPTETSPGGVSIATNVNPDTGLYQAFFKQVIYDKRYIIIKIGVKNIALEGAGIPPFIDGSQKLDNPYNLQFACPIIDCDFNITRKV